MQLHPALSKDAPPEDDDQSPVLPAKVSVKSGVDPFAGAEETRARTAAARREKRAFMAAGRGWKEARGKECGGRGETYHKSFPIGNEKN